MKNSILKDILTSIRDTSPKTQPYDTTAEVVRVEGDTLWVHIPGGVDETPVRKSINANIGDTVNVRVSGGSAWITGNYSAPPTDDTTANVAKHTAENAQRTAKTAKTTAETASRIAGNTAQHFWMTEEGSDTGAHISEVTQEEFLADPANSGGNLLARSNGIAIRDGLEELASFGADSIRMGASDSAHIIIKPSETEFYDRDGNVVANIINGDTATRQVLDRYIFEGVSDMLLEELTLSHDTNLASISYKLAAMPVSTGTIRLQVYDGSYYIGIYEQFKRNLIVPSSGSITSSYGDVLNYSLYIEDGQVYFNLQVDESSDYGDLPVFYLELEYSIEIALSGYVFGNNITPLGMYAFGEGYAGSAAGDYSHKEGNQSRATGEAAHAEGTDAVASGSNSHAQNLGTVAAGQAQTAIGRYNLDNDRCPFIIGNGSSPKTRSNAFTVDWGGEVELFLAKNDFVGTTDRDLYDAIVAAGWENDVLS